MDYQQENNVWVIGHKNPDTDSICAAICYANLKNRLQDGFHYIPKRAGSINEETKYVLQHFGVEPPEYAEDAGAQVKDIAFRRTAENRKCDDTCRYQCFRQIRGTDHYR